MTKIIVLMAIAVVAIQGLPVDDPFDDIRKAANSGAWDQLDTILASKFGKDGWQPVGSVKSLKPIQGGHVYGESEVTFHSSQDLNGMKTQESAGHKVINKDGSIKEFDFKPTFGQNPLFKLS